MSVLIQSDLAPQTVEMTIVAQDPWVKKANGRILTAKVRVPVQRLDPGPTSARFLTVDYDATTGKLTPPAVLTVADEHGNLVYQDRFATITNRDILTDPAFHAQNVYAIAARTLAAFESALGRRLPWSFNGHQLYLVPHAFKEANAYYSDDDRAVLFGYFDPGRELTFTCLSHDVVAHETAHAVLDGLRHRFLEPSLPDQAAFHEALADIVALLSVFSVKEVMNLALGPAEADGRIDAVKVSAPVLRAGLLLSLAEQMGGALNGTRGGLRQSAILKLPADWRTNRVWEESHLRGEILVAAVLDALVGIWTNRLTALMGHDLRLDRDRAGEEGAKSAEHLLRMSLRAIDYLPPVDFEFEDFLGAVLLADAEVAPDDVRSYRKTLIKSFKRFGIAQPTDGRVVNLATLPTPPAYRGLNFGALRTDVDEVFRFVWENAAWLGVDTSFYTHVESVRPAVRVGPDGLVVNEAVADYVQLHDLTVAEFRKLARRWAKASGGDGEAVELSMLLRPETKVQLFGGGTLVFDQFGRAKYHIRKPLGDPRRQTDRLNFLARSGVFDSSARLGFSTGAAKGQRFAALHQPAGQAGEAW